MIVLAHWSEHLLQAYQIYGLGWPVPEARGLLGYFYPWLIKSEVLHYGYALVMLAGLWLLHNFLDESHKLSQDIETPTGSYWHGLMHRREPDYGNAKYWFRRVGEPPLFPQLRAAGLELLGDEKGLDHYRKPLESGKTWDPFRMVDWCESANDERDVAFLRALQAIEIQGLTYFWLDRARLPRP